MKTDSGIEINEEFKRALDAMEDGSKHLFITGRAGTGKSTLLSYYCDHTDQDAVVLAPTGVAALNVHGETIHRFFGFPIGVTVQGIRDREIEPRRTDLYKKLQTIIIDEVSMLRSDLLDCVDEFLRLYGANPKQRFGGVKMIFIGDLYQLPPVVTSAERTIFQGYYKSPYFFHAKVVEYMDMETIELQKIYRQKDDRFIQILNKIRNNSVEDSDINALNAQYDPHGAQAANEDFRISLATTNRRADAINHEHLSQLKGRMMYSEAIIDGDVDKKYFPTATSLQFKVGAQIMMLNNDSGGLWVNGSIGIIKGIRQKDGNQLLVVQLRGRTDTLLVGPYSWEIVQFGLNGGTIVSDVIGTFTQYPFRLAWAVTIHKSQGQTFERVTIDLADRTFASGQLYVALSRCTSLEGICLTVPIERRHVRVDYRVHSFFTTDVYREAEEALPLDERLQILENAIRNQSELHMEYLKANNTRSRRIIIPLEVGEGTYKGKPFCALDAYCTTRKENRTFNVERILSLSAVE